MRFPLRSCERHFSPPVGKLGVGPETGQGFNVNADAGAFGASAKKANTNATNVVFTAVVRGQTASVHSTSFGTQTGAGRTAGRSLSGTQTGAQRPEVGSLLHRARAAGAALLESCAPLGYEDDFGFRYGTPPAGFEWSN